MIYNQFEYQYALYASGVLQIFLSKQQLFPQLSVILAKRLSIFSQLIACGSFFYSSQPTAVFSTSTSQPNRV
jgi:hypothetical protein